MITLRDYQTHAVEAALAGDWNGTRRLIEAPTGSGKALIAAELCRRIYHVGGRVLLVTHVKELVEQDSDALLELAPHVEQGIYCAGLERRDMHQRIILGSVQSLYRRMPDILEHGAFDAVIVDEAHRISPNDAKFYPGVLNACNGAARFGLTATPFRLDGGHLVGLREADGSVMFDELCYRIGHVELVPEYLAPYQGLLGAAEIDVSHARAVAGEFVAADLEEAAMDEKIMREAAAEIARYTHDRRSILIFCPGVDHAEAMAQLIPGAEAISGRTAADDRADKIARFKAGALRMLLNCQILTTGFNAPGVDCVVMMRPTQSLSLAIQMLGRGARPAPGKAECRVLDFAGNIERLKLRDFFIGVEPTLERKQAQAKEAAEREQRDREVRDRDEAVRAKHAARAWSGKETAVWDVLSMTARIIESRNPKYEGAKGIHVRYSCRQGDASLFVGVEYPKFVRAMGAHWFSKRALTMPERARDALRLVSDAIKPAHIVVGQREGSGGRVFWNVIAEQFDAVSAWEGTSEHEPQAVHKPSQEESFHDLFSTAAR